MRKKKFKVGAVRIGNCQRLKSDEGLRETSDEQTNFTGTGRVTSAESQRTKTNDELRQQSDTTDLELTFAQSTQIDVKSMTVFTERNIPSSSSSEKERRSSHLLKNSIDPSSQAGESAIEVATVEIISRLHEQFSGQQRERRHCQGRGKNRKQG